MTGFADLHIHTYYSDSSSSPEEVVEESVRAGLKAIAITDHDTVEGVLPVMRAAEKKLEIIPGIELSTEVDQKDVDILGYLFDLDHELFKRRTEEFRNARLERVKIMLEKLAALGVNDLHLEEVTRLTKSDAVGRPHVARLLVEKGWVRDISHAFEKYLGEGRPAYVEKFRQTPREAIELIKKAGGVAVMAHPMITNKDEIIPALVEAGLEGIEVYYANCSRSVIKRYEDMARQYRLVMTGGSDAHGKVKPNTHIAKAVVPYEKVEELKQRARRER